MVKAVQAEDGVEGYFDALLKSRTQAQVGLLVGKASVGSRDIVLAALPTPTQEGEQVLTVSAAGAAKTAKKGKSSEPAVHISLDADAKDWVIAHALQVSKMLPGGLSVLGLFLFAPDSGYSSCSSQLCDILVSFSTDSSNNAGSSSAAAKAIVAASAATATCTASAAPSAAAVLLPASKPQELLLLHVDSASRKFTMRSCSTNSTTAAAASSLKPCELKFGPSLPQLVGLRCCHSIDLSIPAAAAGTVQMQQLLQDAAAQEAARVLSAVAAIDGQVIGNSSSSSGGGGSGSSQAVADVLPASSSSSSAISVDLYCLPAAAAAVLVASSSSSSSSTGCAGTIRLHGSVEALAYVHKRDPISKAVLELKADIIRSLSARIQLLLADAADAAAEAEAAGHAAAAAAAPHPLLLTVGSGKRVRCGLPYRVLLPWADLNLKVCDYLSDGETAAAAVDRAQQLLHFSQLSAAAVTQVEGPAAKQPKAVSGSAASKPGSGSSGVSCTGPVLAAAGAAVVAAAAMGVALMSLS